MNQLAYGVLDHDKLKFKSNFYFPTGTGRDTYIIDDNGGNTGAKDQMVKPSKGAFMQTATTNNTGPRFIKPSTSNKTVHYWSDGSGRDKYVICNSGGLLYDESKMIHPKKAFMDSLRSSDNFYQSRSATDYSAFFTQTSLKVQQQTKKQNQHVKNLCKPKHVSTKYQTKVDDYINREFLLKKPIANGCGFPSIRETSNQPLEDE